jgi:hypothetical protein
VPGDRRVRSIRPETVEHLLDATASFVAALRSTVAAAGPRRRPRAPPDVQRIPVSDSDLQGDQGRGD